MEVLLKDSSWIPLTYWILKKRLVQLYSQTSHRMGAKRDVYLPKKGNIILIGTYFNLIGEDAKNESWNIRNSYNENWKIIFFFRNV